MSGTRFKLVAFGIGAGGTLEAHAVGIIGICPGGCTIGHGGQLSTLLPGVDPRAVT